MAYSDHLGFLDQNTRSELIGGWEYHFNVSACNMAGKVGPAAEITVRPFFAPLPPGDLTARPGPGFSNLSWSPPSEDGGSPVIGYRVYRSNWDSEWASVFSYNVSVAGTCFNDTNVVCGVTYYYEVRSLNAVGESFFGAHITVVPGAPSPPVGLQVTGTLDRAELSWSPPETDGGSPVLSYYIVRLYSGHIATVPAPTTWYNDTDVGDEMCEYYVTAVNAAGVSGPSEMVWGPPRAPGPVPLVATQGDGYVNLSWPYQDYSHIPPSDGASPILSYRVMRCQFNESTGQNHSWYNVSVLTAQYNDTGVVNGADYRYGVIAINAMGESQESMIEMTPGRPSSPLRGGIDVGEGFINITWSPPLSDGGSPIVSYEVYRNGFAIDSNPYARLSPSASYFNDTNVTAGHHYSYDICASNSRGQSDWGQCASSHYIQGPPPINFTAKAGIGFVDLTWSPPSGEDVYGYTIIRLMENRTDTVTNIFWNLSNPCYLDTTATGLVNGMAYTYYILALAGEGWSAPSDPVMATPGGPDLVFEGAINVISGTASVDSACVGEQVTIRVLMKNQGTYPATGASVLFSARVDGQNITTIAKVTRDLLPGQEVEIEVPWQINATVSDLLLEAEIDPEGTIEELEEEGNQITRFLTIYIPGIDVGFDKPSYHAGEVVRVSGGIMSPTSHQPLTGMGVEVELIDGDGISVGEKQQLVTDSTGGFYCDILIPENAKEGQYHIKATASISEYTYWAYSTEFKVEANAMEIGSILIIGSILAAVTVLAAALVILLRKRT